MQNRSGIYGGIDIGGTKLVAVIGSREGETIDSTTLATSSDPGADLGACMNWLAAHSKQHAVDAIGVACPGPYDRRDRVMLEPPNMRGWHGFRIGEWFDQQAIAPARIMNDANAGAYAEWLWGGHGTVNTLVFLTMSTGMGGGIVVGGNVIEGTHGFAAEIGRIQLADEGPAGFGARGTVEGFLSGPGMAQLAATEKLVCQQLGEPSGLLDAECPDAPTLCALAASGDAAARRVINRITDRLGELVAILGNVLEPDVIVLGTIAAAHPALFLAPGKNAARSRMIPSVHARMRMVASTLHHRAAKQALAVAVLAEAEGVTSET